MAMSAMGSWVMKLEDGGVDLPYWYCCCSVRGLFFLLDAVLLLLLLMVVLTLFFNRHVISFRAFSKSLRVGKTNVYDKLLPLLSPPLLAAVAVAAGGGATNILSSDLECDAGLT